MRQEFEESRLKVLVAPEYFKKLGLALDDARFVGVFEYLKHPHHLVASQIGFDVQ